MRIFKQNNTWLIDLCLLTLLIALFFSFFLGSIPLGVPDEGRYAEIPREMLALHDYLTPHLNGVKYFEKPVFFYWLQVGAIKLLGFSEWSVRLPNALLALFGCLITYTASRILFDRRTGWLASIILATNVLYFGMAHIITLDMTFSVLLSASLLSFLIATQANANHKRGFCYSGYLFAALATLTKGLVGFIFPGLIIFVWLLALNQWRLLKEFYLPSGALIFLIITAPWHILVQLQNPEFFHFYFIDQHFLRYFTKEAGRYKPAWFFIPVLIGGFLPWITLLPQAVWQHFPKKSLAAKQRQIYAFLLLWPSLIFIFFSLSDSKLIPYLLPIFPALAILVGHYLASHWENASRLRGLKYAYISMPILVGLIGAIAIMGSVTTLFKQHLLATTPYFSLLTFIWLGGTLLALRSFQQNKPTATFSWIVGSTALALIIILSQRAAINLGSVKPLAQMVKPLLKADTEIACYENYYQDLPYYLQRQVTVVDWRGELSFGMQHQATQRWMIQGQQFWQTWQSDKRVFVLMHLKAYQKLQKNNAYRFYEIARTANDILLTNHPLPASAYNVRENRAQLPPHANQ